MHTSNKATPKKKPTSNQTIAIVATEFHIERRESYYKVRFRDLDGQKQTILSGASCSPHHPRSLPNS